VESRCRGSVAHGEEPGRDPDVHPVLTQNLHLAPSTQQTEQASFTREEITRRASQFSLKINKKTK
jgi:hypothetical protein